MSIQKIAIKTKRAKEIVDITEKINDVLGKAKDFKGVCFLFVTHTTAALTCADLDPGTDLDMLDAFEEIVPKLAYRHPHDPSHVGDHILSSIIGPSVLVPFKNGKLVLGTWQRVVLVEFSGPRPRNIIFHIISDGKRRKSRKGSQ